MQQPFLFIYTTSGHCHLYNKFLPMLKPMVQLQAGEF